MPNDDRPPGGLLFHEAALDLFGEGECSRGGAIGDVFVDFMHRHGDRVTIDHPVHSALDFVFDERLSDPGVVPLNVYVSEEDHGDLFLTEIRHGARTGLAFETSHRTELGYPASLELTERVVEAQEMIDAGRRRDWLAGERLELHREAWLHGVKIFMPETDDQGRPIDVPNDAWRVVFKETWGYLKGVAIFRALLGVAAIAMGARVPRDGTTDRTVLSSGIWREQPMRLDLERNLLFVPTYYDGKPWVARFEDIWLLNRALHPELEPVDEITEPGHGIGARTPGRAARSRKKPRKRNRWAPPRSGSRRLPSGWYWRARCHLGVQYGKLLGLQAETLPSIT